MKRYSLLSAALIATTMVATQLPMRAQSMDSTASSQKAKHTKKHHRETAHRETAEEIQLREMRETLKAQQDQIDALKSQISAKSGDVTAAQQTAADAQAQAAAAAASAAQAQAAASATSNKVELYSSSVSELQAKTAKLDESVATSQKKLEQEIEAPVALRYKGVTITPGGFAAFEGVWRQHSVNSDINTPYNSIPLPSANEGHTSEMNFSGRQSRLSVKVQGDAGSYKLTGYWEMDWLGTGTSSNNNQSNSYVLRQRQIWGQGALSNGFTVTGGQMWSLVTEDRKGTDAGTSIQPETIDPQYLVGYTWVRQPEIRVQQRFGDYNTGAFTIAASAEQAQITGFTVASSVSAAIPNEYYFGGIGQNGGLYNAAGNIGSEDTAGTGAITTYANNVAPDVVVKAAFDEPWMHFEVGGIGRFLRNEYFPVATVSGTAAAPIYTYGTTLENSTASAGGVFGALRVYPSKMFEIGVQAMGGTGVGRYGDAQLADATLRPNETLEPIRNYHGLFSFIAHPTKKLEMFAYYGGEYAQRTVYTVVTPTGNDLIGYGPGNLSDTGCYNAPAAGTISGGGSGGSISPASCSSPTRYIQEAMGGFIYRIFDSPTKGRLQYWVTYQYVQRNLWSGIGSATTPTGPRATDPMIHVSMRYYIP